MRPINLEELKNIQLDLLEKTADFCEKNNIRYYLSGGTLIGAIRHKGYIPWDDDIDIAMPRPDYDKFINTFNHTGNYYQVLDIAIDKTYGFPFAKVHDTRTFVDELQYNQVPFGVFIDIFPIDGVGSPNQIFQIMKIKKLLHTKKANYFQRTLPKKIINFVGKILLLPFSEYRILKLIDKIARKYPFGTTPKAGVVVNPYGVREIVDTSLFDYGIKKEFEGKMFYVPVGYDMWLRSVFGDYMQLPPEDKRHSPHVSVAYWK